MSFYDVKLSQIISFLSNIIHFLKKSISAFSCIFLQSYRILSCVAVSYRMLLHLIVSCRLETKDLNHVSTPSFSRCKLVDQSNVEVEALDQSNVGVEARNFEMLAWVFL